MKKLLLVIVVIIISASASGFAQPLLTLDSAVNSALTHRDEDGGHLLLYEFT